MFHYTLNNHFRSGYDGDRNSIAGFRTSHQQVWTARYGCPLRPPLSWRDECIRAARLISQSTELIPNVLFSGGMDSEVVLRSFYESQAPFKVTIMKLPKGLNQLDLQYATSVCQDLNIKPDIIDVDPFQFWQKDLWTVAEAAQSFSPQICLCLYLADLVEGLPVIGNGNVHLTLKDAEICLEEGERWSAINRYFVNKNQPAIPGFFQYTPEQVSAFMNIPGLSHMIRSAGHGKFIKWQLYSQDWPELIDRPKFTGFELLQIHDSHYRKQLKTKFGHQNEMIYFPVSEFLYKKATANHQYTRQLSL